MSVARAPLAAVLATVALFGLGFACARVLSSPPEAPGPGATLVGLPGAVPVTVEAPSLRGAPAALAQTPATSSTASSSSTGGTATGATGLDLVAPGPAGGGGTKTFSSGGN